MGLEKLDKAASQIAIMREEIEYLQPHLEVSAENIRELMITVEKESLEAAVVSSRMAIEVWLITLVEW